MHELAAEGVGHHCVIILWSICALLSSAYGRGLYSHAGLMKIPTIRTNRPYIKKPPNSFLLFVKEKREEGVGKDLSAKRSHVIFGKMVGGVTELICMDM